MKRKPPEPARVQLWIRWLSLLAWIGFLINLLFGLHGVAKIALAAFFGALILADISYRLWRRRASRDPVEPTTGE